MLQRYLAITLFLLGLLVLSSNASGADVDGWPALEGDGHVVMMRHALAPGVGDPVDFRLGDCQTQRNLSEEGRQQAKRIGDLMRENGITAADVYSSQWCRCQDTASLLNLGDPTELPAINSFFETPNRANIQTERLRTFLDQQPLKRLLVLVTHQVNITEFAGVYPESGELVFLKRMGEGRYEVVGRVKTR